MLFNALTLLTAATLAAGQSTTVTPAPVVSGNPLSASYLATLPAKPNSPLSGSVSAVVTDGLGVRFSVSFSGLPATGGPFMYHIHEKPVPSDGNCTGTGAHLDPYKRGEVPICDASKPETCQTGDLSGKFGNITEQSWSQEYTDVYSALRKDSPAYFGNLSFVLHLSNKTRIGCANFTLQEAGTPYPGVSSGSLPKPTDIPTYNTTVVPSATATGSPMTPTSATPSAPAEFTGAAAVARVGGGVAALVGAVAAMVL